MNVDLGNIGTEAGDDHYPLQINTLLNRLPQRGGADTKLFAKGLLRVKKNLSAK